MSSAEQSQHAEPVNVAAYATEGEAEVAQAKLRAFGIESFLSDQVEGGTVPVDGEAGVAVQVRASDATDALHILTEPPAAAPDGPST